MKLKQTLNLNLYHLWLSLQDLQSNTYPCEINKKIDELLIFVENFLFESIPHGYDVTGTKCVYYTYLEQKN